MTILYSPEVRLALDNGTPVVALESTIISHGMPYPLNLEVALEVEQVVRDHGAVPATIAVIDGVPHIGVEKEQLINFAQYTNIIKCSRRDLPFVIAQKLHGGTTVAATMMLADMAGIAVFATGGIGGVHRGAEVTMDISADLPEFARSKVAVVSAGAKAILDLARTLEYLETSGIPVIGYGTDEFPSFYNRSSGLALSMRMDTPAQVASFINANNALGMKGILIANPIPEQSELDKKEMDTAVEGAIREATASGIIGKDLTPYLLKQLNEVTAGRSQESNRALVLNNAMVAAMIAVELSRF